MYATDISVVYSHELSRDGIAEVEAKIQWKHPTNPDAYALQVTCESVTDPARERVIHLDTLIVNGLADVVIIRFREWVPGTYCFTFYTINVNNRRLLHAPNAFVCVTPAPVREYRPSSDPTPES